MSNKVSFGLPYIFRFERSGTRILSKPLYENINKEES